MKTVTIAGRKYRLNPRTLNCMRAEARMDEGLLSYSLSTDQNDAVAKLTRFLSRLDRLLPLTYEIAEPVEGEKPTYEAFVEQISPHAAVSLIDPVLEAVFTPPTEEAQKPLESSAAPVAQS